ncbi:STAS domain-containing protein [Desulfogranum mediterraneum]|uniref:STAS domain-containing protein n=1 Tax=Desulfogranum mediterraneum TaxID=160661 RepID=UPI0003F71221|nr:STAS domain-containing protein [Desulfogranum mediterraneum]
MRRYNLPERFDVNSAATVEQELLEIVEGEQVDQLVCDFSETVYISSAGLRVMLLVVKQLKKKSGSCLLSRMRPPVLHIFQSAGLDKIMDIETSAEPTP